MKASFDFFVAVDWSGAKGSTQKGIQVAVCRKGDSPPELVSPPNYKHWSRLAAISWLNEFAGKESFLVGIDFSFAPPYLDEGKYFPGADISSSRAQDLWFEIEDKTKNDPHLYAGSFLENEQVSELFHVNKQPGRRYRRRYRVTEQECRNKGLGPAETFFHLIGPTQVGMGSLCGMRSLLRLQRNIAIWPFENTAKRSVVVVEIYTRPFLIMSGAGLKKIRELEVLNQALDHFHSRSIQQDLSIDDHIGDAILSAAGLRFIAEDSKYWHPAAMSEEVACTEGWTFGVP
ncbi:MAG: hypothetical protein IID52_04155 [Proteobacteria bacterium]|nr:hypothetical protein [Pseudomonadota bacterium]